MNPNNGDPENKGRLDHVRDSLYSSKKKFTTDIERNTFTHEDVTANSEWEHVDKKSDYTPRVQITTWANKFFLVSVAFFVLCAAFAGYMFFGGSNTISSSKIDIVVTAPSSVPGGKTTSFDVAIKNNNEVTLEGGSLVVQFPAGTRSEKNMNNEYTRAVEKIGSIPAGGKITKTFSAILFGEKDEVKTIGISLEYQAKGSEALLTKKKEYDIAINSSPVNIAIKSVSEVSSNQEITLNAELSSNSSTDLNNLLFKLDTPPGFTLVSTLPKATFGTNVWAIGTLKPSQKKTITIRGRLEGQDGDDKVFTFHVGTQSENDEKIITADFVSSTYLVAIKKPFIGAEIVLDSDNSRDHVAKLGSVITGSVHWFSNVSMPVSDVEITAKLVGSLFEKNSVSAEDGFYRSTDNTIVWNQTNVRELAQITPGEEGNLRFTFSLKSPTLDLAQTLKNPSMSVNVSISGKRMSGAGLPEEVASADIKNIKVVTDLVLSPKVLYFSGPFKNTGPMPLKSDEQTTLALGWTVSNSYNNVSSAVLTAELPEYVKWGDKVSPGTDIQYDAVTRRITWNIGNVQAGVGKTLPAIEGYFRVRVTPSVTQRGTTPVLLKNIEVVGTDTFTQTTVGASNRDMPAILSGDIKSVDSVVN